MGRAKECRSGPKPPKVDFRVWNRVLVRPERLVTIDWQALSPPSKRFAEALTLGRILPLFRSSPAVAGAENFMRRDLNGGKICL